MKHGQQVRCSQVWVRRWNDASPWRLLIVMELNHASFSRAVRLGVVLQSDRMADGSELYATLGRNSA